MDTAQPILEYTKGWQNCDFYDDTQGDPPHNNGSYYFYDSGSPVWDADVDYYRKDNQWHEEAYYFKLPSSATSYDGEFYAWTDGYPDYDLSEADTHKTWQWPTRYETRLPENNLVISFGNYYKGYVSSGYNPQFWMDDIEIWDGIPSDTEIHADVNQDNQINTTDAMLTLRNSLGLDMSQTNWQASATTGDVNCDNVTNSTDAMLILRKSLGLEMENTGWCEE